MISFNTSAEANSIWIGRGQIAVCRIDDALSDPESVAALGRGQFYTQDHADLYPGVRSPLSETFSVAFRDWLTPMLQRVGMLEAQQTIQHDSSFFSVVTTAATALLPIQRIPHYDSTDPNLLAAIIYLCSSPRFGGTSFYRHRKTGYEEITAENQRNYHVALDHEMRTHGPPKKEYMNGDNPLFETVFSNALAFNSTLIYPGRLLHAGNIANPFTPPQDSGEWRLTITSLLRMS